MTAGMIIKAFWRKLFSSFGYGTRHGRDGTCMGVILHVLDFRFLALPFLLDTFGIFIDVAW
jgi:hypothetical protein